MCCLPHPIPVLSIRNDRLVCWRNTQLLHSPRTNASRWSFSFQLLDRRFLAFSSHSFPWIRVISGPWSCLLPWPCWHVWLPTPLVTLLLLWTLMHITKHRVVVLMVVICDGLNIWRRLHLIALYMIVVFLCQKDGLWTEDIACVETVKPSGAIQNKWSI